MGKLLHVDVIMDNLENNPQCPHGPTLRFRRIAEDGQRDYFACSACRDRKDCNFHHWCDKQITQAKSLAWELERDRTLPRVDHLQLLVKLEQVRLQKKHKRAYCHSCSLLLLPEDMCSHSDHDVTVGVATHQLAHPSELIKPLQSSKKEAQFLFSKQATQTILSILLGAGVKHVLCIGTPRIHEHIQSQYNDQLSSLLLDIDHRYHQFFDKKQFCWFNCFNNYFFAGKPSHKVLRKFLKKDGGEGIALVTDPPFGGRVEPLTYTIQQMSSLHRSLNPACASTLPVMWIFPYFMEPQILANFPNYHMSDYKVNYENHPLFAQGPKGRKLGSPIRIFTNISPKQIELPSEEGYRSCNICERWVSSENNHCSDCDQCTSKNGQTYTHCLLCNRCVKPSWRHCTTCNRCSLASHECSQFATPSKCFTCTMEDHKTKDCPLRDAKFEVHKIKRRGRRLNEFHGEPVTKKRKDTQLHGDNVLLQKKLKKKALVLKKTQVTRRKQGKIKSAKRVEGKRQK